MSSEQSLKVGSLPTEKANPDGSVALDTRQPLDQPGLTKLRRAQKDEHILDEYAAKRIDAGAVLVEKKKGFGPTVKIRMTYPPDRVAGVQPEFEKALWRARALERQSMLVVGGRPSQVLAEMVFSVIVYLLGVLDSVEDMPSQQNGKLQPDAPANVTREQRIANAVKIAETELVRLQEFACYAELKAALKRYVLGLPIGILVVLVLAWICTLVSVFDVEGTEENLVRAVVAGGIGATASVMIRITRGQHLDIDSTQGNGLILMAGAFRPLVGAVLGVALYVLLQAGLMPLQIPEEAGGYFFTAIAFLGGFSERWAQDTIVRSTPMRTSASEASLSRSTAIASPKQETLKEPRSEESARNATDTGKP